MAHKRNIPTHRAVPAPPRNHTSRRMDSNARVRHVLVSVCALVVGGHPVGGEEVRRGDPLFLFGRGDRLEEASAAGGEVQRLGRDGEGQGGGRGGRWMVADGAGGTSLCAGVCGDEVVVVFVVVVWVLGVWG